MSTGSTTVNEWLDKFHDHLKVKNYSPDTLKNYLFYLKHFFIYLRENGITDIASVTKETIRNYQIHLYEKLNRNGSPDTVPSQNVALRAIKSFFRFLTEEDYLVADPARGVSYAKEPKTLPRSILTPSEARKILHAPDTKTVLGYRDRAILEVLYSSGIRRKELSDLMLEDVDATEGFLRINEGKGKKDRIVPLGKIACRYLENYIKAVRPSLIRHPYENHLFLSLSGGQLQRNDISIIARYYAEKAKVKKHVTTHTFRHTCATLMLRNKANIRHIQELLGHSSLNSTQIYTSVSIADLKEVHSKCHPREKDTD